MSELADVQIVVAGPVAEGGGRASVLPRFTAGTGRQFAFFGEQPLVHCSPGAGIGVALP